MQQVLEYIRRHGGQSETLNVLYVTDERGKLIDDIRIREFLLAAPDVRVSELMDRRFVSLSSMQDQEEAIDEFRRNDRVALPVVNDQGILFGIVTIDDILDIREEEDTEDIQKLGGSEALDEPYLATSIWNMVKKRAGWLVILLLGEMLTTSAMHHFEDDLQKAAVLGLFIPLIISAGGNAGSQATSLIIRAMSLGEFTLSRLVADSAAGADFGPVAGPDSGRGGLAAHRTLGQLRRPRLFRPLLVADCRHGGLLAAGHCAVGGAFGGHAAHAAQAPGPRPGHVLGSLRSHAGGRDGPDYLLLCGHSRAARHVAVEYPTPRPPPLRERRPGGGVQRYRVL